MSRNSKRVSPAADTQSQAPQAPPASAQSPQDTSTRTSTVEAVPLPSQGRFYPPGHPLCGVEHVEIRYMTARDEDILTSPSLLKQGLALDRFVQGIICDSRIKVDDLLLGDKSAIMIAARVTGYGPDYEVNITCPECSTESEHAFDLSDYSKYYTCGDDTSEFAMNASNRFEATLPVSGHVVELKMVTSKDESRILKSQQLREKNKLADSTTTDFLKMIIHSIDGNDNRSEVSEMIMNMPARDSRYLRKHYPGIVPNVDLKEEIECLYCGAVTEMEVPLEATFFWPES
jgi:hypothetical protein